MRDKINIKDSQNVVYCENIVSLLLKHMSDEEIQCQACLYYCCYRYLHGL